MFAQFEDCSFEDLQGADARKAILIIGVMAAHAFGEGSGVGVSFSGERGWAQVRRWSTCLYLSVICISRCSKNGALFA